MTDEVRGYWLDVGCGGKKKSGWLGLDKRNLPGVDFVHDVEEFPWPLPDDSCSLLLMSHLWEHLKPWKSIEVMDEMWRILRGEGRLMLTMPCGFSPGYIADPTHCNPANSQTWEYFDPQFDLYKVYQPRPWYLLQREHQEFGNMLVVMQPKKEELQQSSLAGDPIKIQRDDYWLKPSEVANAFHKLEYDLRTPKDLPTWMGLLVDKTPFDLWNYQELIYEIKPEVIIETGTANGSSALYFAQLLDLIAAQEESNKDGFVITIDIDDGSAPFEANPSRTNPGERPKHPRIQYILGSSTDKAVALKVSELIGNRKPVLLILDSSHIKGHVYNELQFYWPLVTKGSYIVVEDTNVNGHPVYPEHGAGPYEAVELWLRGRDEFVIDEEREKRFMYTHNPRGWLRRVK